MVEEELRCGWGGRVKAGWMRVAEGVRGGEGRRSCREVVDIHRIKK